MDRQTLLVIILGVSAVNGIFSPYLNVAIPITAVLLPELFPKTVEWVLFFSSIFVATCTLFFSGVPAALVERLVLRNTESLVPMYVWLAVALLLSVPALGPLSRL
jgi:hypothetical protein